MDPSDQSASNAFPHEGAASANRNDFYNHCHPDSWFQSQPPTWNWLYEDMFLQDHVPMATAPNHYDESSIFNAVSASAANPSFLPASSGRRSTIPHTDHVLDTSSLHLSLDHALTAPQNRPQTSDMSFADSFDYPMTINDHLPSDPLTNNMLAAAGSQQEANSAIDFNPAPLESPQNLSASMSNGLQGIESAARHSATAQQHEAIETLVKLAFGDCSSPLTSLQPLRTEFWKSEAANIEQKFGLSDLPVDTTKQPSVLHHFIKLYFEHFDPLCPLFRQQGFKYDDLSGDILVTMISIGSMYGGPIAAQFGRPLQDHLRLALLTRQIWLQDSADTTNSVSLCQSLLLAQVAGLWFGSRKAISFAQQLNSSLVSQARKSRLFEEIKLSPLGTQDWWAAVREWTQMEERKKLAYCILRADGYLSVLLGTRPLLSGEEINLMLPCSPAVWEKSTHELSHHLMQAKLPTEDQGDLSFSELFQISMDRAEALPSLRPSELELLLWAMQEFIWRFSHDPQLLRRLTGHSSFEIGRQPYELAIDRFARRPASPTARLSLDYADSLAWFNEDPLDCSLREMEDLRTDCDRLLVSLRKWKQAFYTASSSENLVTERDALLRNRLLYHLIFIRLNAKVDLIHRVAFDMDASTRQLKVDDIKLLYDWSKSRAASVALDNAYAVQTLITQEIKRDPDRRARFNILAFTAMYHAASIVWVCGKIPDARSSTENFDSMAGRPPKTGRGIDLRLHQDNTFEALSKFTILLQQVTPDWKGLSFFSERVAVMARHPFPVDRLEKEGWLS